MTTGALAAIGSVGRVLLKGAEAWRTTRHPLCSCHMRATWTREVANSTMLTRCCTAREVVTLVKCTPPTSAMSAGVPTRKTDPSKTSKFIRRNEQIAQVFPRSATTMWFPFSLMRVVAVLTPSKEKRTALSRTATRGFNLTGEHKCKLDLWDGCWNEFKRLAEGRITSGGIERRASSNALGI